MEIEEITNTPESDMWHRIVELQKKRDKDGLSPQEKQLLYELEKEWSRKREAGELF